MSLRRRRIGQILGVLCALSAGIALVAMGLGLYLFNHSKSLPDLQAAAVASLTSQNTIVYAADGSVLAEWHGDQDRTIVPFEQMPASLKAATVAIEDRRFYRHGGVDIPGLIRAMRVNVEAGEVRQGGSTITQQLVKILFTDGERTLSRKSRELQLALELETRADKDEILAAYLNTVYFGQGAYGVESAARHYFGKPTDSLTLPECALLAGVIRSPTGCDPFSRPQHARARRNLVLAEMRRQGYISEAEERVAASSALGVAPPEMPPQVAPHFVEYVKRDLVDRLGAAAVYNGGLRVYTTLDPDMQEAAEKAARILSGRKDPTVSLVSVRHSDGAIVAMVGGRDFQASQFNLAVQARRQPGSAFKPFVLATALSGGIEPDHVFSASPYTVRVADGLWSVQNYENGRTQSSMTLRTATRWSVNAVFARLIMRVGAGRVAAMSKRMGIESPVASNPAIALGGLEYGVSPLEMASAYGTIASGGYRVPPKAVLRVTDGRGPLLYQPASTRKRVLERDVAVTTAMMLHDVIENGTGRRARIDSWAAGKTGTTQSHRDAWFVGWSGGLSTAVWVGYPNAQIAMTDVHGIKVTGGTYPAEAWRRFMKTAVRLESESKSDSAGAVTQEHQVQVIICQESLRPANRWCPTTVEIWLAPDIVPDTACNRH